jgi:hypothetical protein
LRQGNENALVHIHRYVTEGSFDAYMWQTLENKARFIAQVMNGSVTVRQAEDLESGALTFAEIKAIASGNPAVMEKVKVDTEIRRLDQLKASHINQQHNIRWQVKSLPEHIASAHRHHDALTADISTRNAHAEEEFTMQVGNRDFSGKGAREDAGNALNSVILSWRDDKTSKVRGEYKGFEILSRGSVFDDGLPEVFIRGKATYRRISIRRTPPAPSPASSIRCATLTARPSRSNARSRSWKKHWRTIACSSAVRSSMNLG